MITSFKELMVWQRADPLTCQVFDLTDAFPRAYLYDLTCQLRRAVLSVPTNIAEGGASFHPGEFLQFLSVARRLLSETQYLLDFTYRRSLIRQAELLGLELLFEVVGKMFNSLAKSIRQRKSSKHPSSHSVFNP